MDRTASSPRPPGRDWQLLPTLLLALIVLLLVAIAGLWWWSGTQDSLTFAMERIARTQPIEVVGARGSLREGVTLRKLTWRRGQLTVEAEDVELHWRPLFLLGGNVKLSLVQAGVVRVQNNAASSAPSQPPQSLDLPLDVELDHFKVGRIESVGAQPFELQGVEGRYWFARHSHHLKLDNLQWQGRAYKGEATLASRAPMQLDAALSGSLVAKLPDGRELPLQLAAKAQGPLADLQVQAHAQGEGDAASMQADAQARIAPWQSQPVTSANVDLKGFDMAAIVADAPTTQLAGHISVTPQGMQTWSVQADLSNALAGPWDEMKLPVEKLNAQGEWKDGVALVRQLDAAMAGGKLHASGEWDKAGGWNLKGVAEAIDPAQLHTAFAAAPLGGRIAASQHGGTTNFDADLRAAGAPRADTAAKTGVKAGVKAGVKGSAKTGAKLRLQQLSAKGDWDGKRLALPHFIATTSDAKLNATIQWQAKARAGEGHVALDAPGLHLLGDGRIAQAQGRGALALQMSDLTRARTWLQQLPLKNVQALPDVAGSANFSVAWQGGWDDPALQVRLSAPTLQMRAATPAAAAAAWKATDVRGTWNGRLADAEVALRANASQGQRRGAIDFTGRGGRDSRSGQWHAQVTTLTASFNDPAVAPAPWQLVLSKPVEIRAGASQMTVGAGIAKLSAPARPGSTAPAPADLVWDAAQWSQGELKTRGKLTGLTTAWLELVGGSQLSGSAFSGDMVFDAQWDAQVGRTVRIDASVARIRGDVNVLAETAPGVSERVAAGVRNARVTLSGRGDDVTLAFDWESERAGTAHGRIATRFSGDGKLGRQWAADAPLSGTVQAQLPKIGVWSLLAPPGWRLRGSLAADVRIAGTRAAPQLSGTVAADDLALRSVVDGIELRNGRLRGRFEGSRLVVTEFVLHGASEAATANKKEDNATGGTLSATGEASWSGASPVVNASAQLTRLRASIRSDRQLTVSGKLDAHVDAQTSQVKGELTVDQARIVLPEEAAPKLDTDVVVRTGTVDTRKPSEKATTPVPADSKGRAIDVAVDIDLGRSFHVEGHGLRTDLRGKLNVSAKTLTQPQVTGTIRTEGGEYRAYNQRLDVERGLIRFTGRYDNPSLDILAVRPNLVQRVGVTIHGTAQAPFVQLYADPDLPEAEKLAWLVTGRAAPATGAESALVQQAALALLASRGPGGGGFAQHMGLDELSVRRDTTAGSVVTVGKRFASNFYASYERSLSGALGTLYIFYDVSRRLTVRAQAGEQAGVDLIFTFKFD